MNRRLRDRVAAVVFGTLIVLTAVGVTWVLRQGYAVYRLTRGVGDTWFLAANGERWFRLDEQRHDVPLAEIPEHLQHAFIAIEDHRFYRHPGIDRGPQWVMSYASRHPRASGSACVCWPRRPARRGGPQR